MTFKLFALLKKDAILAWRSKSWTIFELFLPIVILLIAHGFTTLMDPTVMKMMDGPINDEFNQSSPIQFNTDSFCHLKQIPVNVYWTDSRYFLSYDTQTKTWSPTPSVPSEEDIKKGIDDCEKAILVANTTTQEIYINVPSKMTDIPEGDWASPLESKTETHTFSTLIYHALLLSNGRLRPTDEYTVKRIEIRSPETTETLLPYIFALIALSITISIMNLVRVVVTEKATVKPYLSAIGLPSWMFYTEHFIAAFVKTLITIIGITIWFSVIKYVDGFVMFLGVLFYVMGALSFACLIATMFMNAKRGIEAVLFLWLTFLVMACFAGDYESHSWTNVLWAINIHFAYRFLLLSAQSNALADHSMGVGQLFDNTYVEGTLPGLYLLMMIFDVIWMFALALVIDRYGGKLALLKNLFNLCKPKKDRSSSGSDIILEGCVEEDATRKEAPSDVELSEVVKVYSTGEKAVNGLSFRAIRGQVSILLGQNGCGKSTTFSMISGVNLPTSGSIKVGGIDAVANREAARKIIGFCPQYNPLYDKLTVVDHLRLVNALKGGSKKTFGPEATELLTSIGMLDKAFTQSSKLSGGMKRKLCVCMAMIGDSKVVLLDEPTAGMDPGARKDVQVMLEKAKVDRTILLTTHYMDEAERLGDWVFVMSYGKMAASGSLNYLKRKFGSGYVLTVVLDVKCERAEAVESVKKICAQFVPNSSLKDQRGQMIEITLPEEEKSGIVGLLKKLESVMDEKSATNKNTKSQSSHSKNLKITTLGLSLSSLETVFIKICDDCDVAIAKENKLDDRRKIAGERFDALTKMKTEQQKIGFSLFWSQFLALLLKRFYYWSRNIYQLFFQIFLPIFIILIITLAKSQSAPSRNLVQKVTMKEFPKSVVLLRGTSTKVNNFKNNLKPFEQLIVEETSETDNKKLYYDNYKRKLGFILDSDDKRITAHYSPMVKKAAPILLASLGQKYSYRDVYIKYIIPDSDAAGSATTENMMLPMMIAVAFALVTAPFVQFTIEERICKFSHQQHLTGLNRLLFWTTNIVWDAATFMIVVIACLIIFASCGEFHPVMHYVILLFLLLLFCIIPITYLTALLFESPTKASTLLILYQIVFAVFGSSLLIILIVIKSKAITYIAPILFLLCPPSAFLSGFHKLISWEEIEDNPTGIVAMTIEFKELWEWVGLGRDVTFLILSSVILAVIIVLMQCRCSRVACFKATHKKKPPVARQPLKSLAKCDAVDEQEKLLHAAQPVENCTVVVTDLVRTFGKFRAVNGICLTVKENECFGLLGTNGAGKTTTFDILTGLRFPSGGTAIIEGRDVVTHNYVGYCPQFDSILPDLKCREALQIMAKLHGYQDPNLAVEHVLTCVGMVEHAHKRIRMCSGGQKRKISVGIAMLTRAKCVMMDEPTAGIDPRARREIWEILDWMREKSGSSIVLTSHSMEECEALCSRIAILRKGEMIALGTSQDLKSQYGNTYTMTLVLEKIEDRERICEAVQQEMADAVLKTPATNITTSIVWELPKTGKDRWSEKYEKVEKMAGKLKVKDFMLTQASLEDTFINLTD